MEEMVGAGEVLRGTGETLMGAGEVLGEAEGTEGILVGEGETLRGAVRELIGAVGAEEERLKLRVGAGSPRMDLVWTSRDKCSWQGSLVSRSSVRGRPREAREESA